MKIQGMLAAVAALAFSGAVATAQDDDRIMIDIDEATQAQLLTSMRGLVVSLDKLMLALSEGDFDAVARVGEIDLGFGHSKLQAMVDAGATDEEILARREQMRANRAARAAGGGTKTGSGMGQKMPEDFRMFGQSMHMMAEDMAIAARAVEGTPTAADFQAVLQGVQAVTGSCVACHNTYRIR
ncbi:MAG: hypothetical protein L3J36_04375 [Rhodobacteraceae bacterium]|nr:hypothetical protein [Paracoccaceae bacterium]